MAAYFRHVFIDLTLGDRTLAQLQKQCPFPFVNTLGYCDMRDLISDHKKSIYLQLINLTKVSSKAAL